MFIIENKNSEERMLVKNMKKDVLWRALLSGGCIRLYAVSAKELVQQAKELHGLSRVCTAALGRQLMMTAMMAAQLKKEGQSLTTIVSGNGPAGNLVCTGGYGAMVKGYAARPEVELPLNCLGKLDVKGAVGTVGKLKVMRDLSMKEPYTGISDLVSGEIAEDFAHYFTVSEQQPSLVYLGVRVRPGDGQVLSAGGLVAQTMPGFPPEQTERAVALLEQRASAIGKLAERLELAPMADVLQALFYDMELDCLEQLEPKLHCDCSRERTERALVALGEKELSEMIEQDDGAELTCQFCNKAYHFTSEQLSALLLEAGGRRIEFAPRDKEVR